MAGTVDFLVRSVAEAGHQQQTGGKRGEGTSFQASVSIGTRSTCREHGTGKRGRQHHESRRPQRPQRDVGHSQRGRTRSPKQSCNGCVPATVLLVCRTTPSVRSRSLHRHERKAPEAPRTRSVNPYRGGAGTERFGPFFLLETTLTVLESPKPAVTMRTTSTSTAGNGTSHEPSWQRRSPVITGAISRRPRCAPSELHRPIPGRWRKSASSPRVRTLPRPPFWRPLWSLHHAL